MTVDEALLREVAAGRSGPVLRLYRWHPAAVSLGHGQQAACELDLERCRRAGIDVVQRISGGRAVLHGDELTYCVVSRDDDPRLGVSIAESHRAIASSLMAGLRHFGIEARLERRSPAPSPRPRTGDGRTGDGRTGNAPETRARARAGNHGNAMMPCFSSAARWEITCQGRKLIGSAQRRVRGGLMQHGSILVGPQHRQLPDLLQGLDAQRRDQLKRQLTAGSTHLSELCGGPVDSAELMACLSLGFAETMDIELKTSELSRRERARAQVIAAARSEVVNRWEPIDDECLGHTSQGYL